MSAPMAPTATPVRAQGRSAENVALIRRLYDAFADGSSDVIAATFADDVVWHEGGRHCLAGEYRGFDGVMEVNGRAAELTDGTLAVEVHDIIGSDDHVVVLQTIRATRFGREHELDEVLVVHVAEQRVREVWVAYPDPGAVEELFGRSAAEASSAAPGAGERLQRIRAAYAAAAKGDFGPFTSLLSPDVVWQLPGGSEFAGTTTSRDALFGRMLRQAERCGGEISIEFVDGVARGRLVTVAERVRARRTDGPELDLEAVVVFRFDDAVDVVVEAQDFFDDSESYDRFWG